MPTQERIQDRLNTLLTPAGWTRKYRVHTSPNFERSNDQKTVAKVFVTCELTIFGIGSHSATGEGWTDDDNAGTKAQAFKRACSCFGLGRYLYHFSGVWVDLDERKRPRSIPKLFGWATPQGWRQGLRPQRQAPDTTLSNPPSSGNGGTGSVRNGPAMGVEESSALIQKIEAMAEALGRRLYRGVLKTIARAWNPTEIQDAEVLRKVLEQMQAAERELRRLNGALDRVGHGALVPILRSMRVSALDQIDNLDSLRKVVLAVEQVAELTQ
jgi:hypothetical protein